MIPWLLKFLFLTLIMGVTMFLIIYMELKDFDRELEELFRENKDEGDK